MNASLEPELRQNLHCQKFFLTKSCSTPILITGETATFRFKATGTPYPTIQWFKGWREVTSSDEFTIDYDKETDEHTFTIHNVGSKDSGKYHVQLTSDTGKNKYGVSLMVQERPADEVPFSVPLKRLDCTMLLKKKKIVEGFKNNLTKGVNFQ